MKYAKFMKILHAKSYVLNYVLDASICVSKVPVYVSNAMKGVLNALKLVT